LVDDILLQAGIINKFRARGSQDRFLVVVQATDMKLQAEIMAKVQAARERARQKVETERNAQTRGDGEIRGLTDSETPPGRKTDRQEARELGSKQGGMLCRPFRVR
jgi:hypothetical protein